VRPALRALLVSVVATVAMQTGAGGLGYVLLTNDAGARLIQTHDFGRTWHVVRRWAG
jgi:putative copper export protein